MTTRLCDANASFSSTRSRSPDADPGAGRAACARPARDRCPSPCGSTPATAPATKRPSGSTPSSRASLLARDHQRGRAVVEAARVPGRHVPSLRKAGFSARELLRGRVRPRMLVLARPRPTGTSSSAKRPPRQRRPAPLRLERRTRPDPRARFPNAPRRSRRSRPSTRAGTSPPAAGWGSASRASCPRPSGCRAGTPCSGFGMHERRAAHRLDAAGDEQVAVARGDRVTGGDDRGQSPRRTAG